MNAISPVAPYLAHNSQPTFSPPQNVDDLAKIPPKLGSGFIVTAAQNPNNPNTGWVKGFYVPNPEGNLDASVQEARDYVKANYPNLDPNKVFVSSPSQIPEKSPVLAPRQVLITGSDGKVSQIGRIQDAVSAGRFQPPSIEEKSIFQKTGLSNLHPELANYNPLTDKHIDPNSKDGEQVASNNVVNEQANSNSSQVRSSSSQPAIENKSDKENEDEHDEEANSETRSINVGDTTHRKSLIHPLGWGESVDKQA